ncbi:MAG TPA: FAD-binding oxidoreductase [Candidatus Angelobacter sp.]|nr:FAD-binding oxidoreductase [Candidatus Angelobacter sp.]
MSSAASATEKSSLSLLSATLVNSVPLSPAVRLLTLQVESGSPLSFLPGQCIRIEQELDGKLVPLVYSIASPPRADNCLELCVKPGRKGSPADRLCSTRVGAELRISRPQGGFVVQQKGRASLFLAAGTGIAPIRSMIHLLAGARRHELCLIFGARCMESLFFHSEFLALASRNPGFRYVPVLSRPHEAWNGACGYVQHHLGAVSRTRDTQAYLCGPLAMVETASRILVEQGWPEEMIHYERNGY